MGWPPSDNEEILTLRARARSEQERNLFRPPYVSTTTGNDLDWRPGTMVQTQTFVQRIRRVLSSSKDILTGVSQG